jgi:hypothetical protein
MYIISFKLILLQNNGKLCNYVWLRSLLFNLLHVHVLYYVIMYVFTDVKLNLSFLKLHVISMSKH